MDAKFQYNKLTSQTDWDDYYKSRQVESVVNGSKQKTIFDDILKSRSGNIFEIGCGGSSFLLRAASFGWNIGGIDYNSHAIELLKKALEKEQITVKTELVCGDACSESLLPLQRKYDVFVSLGFLEHFASSENILKIWKHVLNESGRVVSLVPNLYSINAYLFKRYDKKFYDEHIKFTLKQFDKVHTDAGLAIIENARFCGKYDAHMLIPWGAIRKKIKNETVFKTVKYVFSLGIEKILRFFPSSHCKLTNSYIVGVYKR